jgi:hypothetical protein
MMLAFGMLLHAQAPASSGQQAGPVQQPAQVSADERQKKLRADAEQLRVLAQALKASVDAATKDELSVKVIHQAEQIEKLAKAVKEQRPPQ